MTPDTIEARMASTKLLARIKHMQARCDAMKGKPGYLAMLARLRDAKLAALARGRNDD